MRGRDPAPVIAAEALLAHGMDADVVVAYLRKTRHLKHSDANAALAAAQELSRPEHRAERRPSSED